MSFDHSPRSKNEDVVRPGASPSTDLRSELLAAHTPGPWSVRDADTVAYIQSGRAARIADVHSFLPTFGPGREERNANARLIAAAPDMLEALQYIDANPEAVFSVVLQKVRAAISRATGAA